MKSYRLEDGSVIEELKITIDGVEYQGSLSIGRVDRYKSSFSVSFGDLQHEDTSMFDHSAVAQMRLHAEFVLEDMVRNWLRRNSGKR